MSYSTGQSDGASRQFVLELSHSEALQFLLKPESYCSLDLPPYIVFDGVVAGVHQVLDGRNLSEMKQASPREHDDVNHTIVHNKDGRYTCRRMYSSKFKEMK